MVFYKGGLSHTEILNLTWQQFIMYIEYMNYLKLAWSGNNTAQKEKRALDLMDRVRFQK